MTSHRINLAHRDASISFNLEQVNSIHPECRFHLEIQEEETKCAELLSTQPKSHRACRGVWDNITCWRPADVGETVTVPCPKVFSNFYSKPGNISKNCTSDGWSDTFPDFMDACGFNDPDDDNKCMQSSPAPQGLRRQDQPASELNKQPVLRQACACCSSVEQHRLVKLHCTRNYIHLNLFLSFILRAISVLVKDSILYSSSGTWHCPDQPSSWVGCKLSLVFFQYCIMANFYWLLVEGLYLHTLLVAIFPPSRCFLAYLLIGWAAPTVGNQRGEGPEEEQVTGAVCPEPALWQPHVVVASVALVALVASVALVVWVVSMASVASVPEASARLVRGVPRPHPGRQARRTPTPHRPGAGTHRASPTVQVNFFLFISIVRILLQKLTSPDVGGNDQPQYSAQGGRRALGGPPAVLTSRASSHWHAHPQVQCELKRRWRGLCPTQPGSRDYRLHSWSMSRNGSESALQMHRGSRAPSLLQTETSVL
ncbi:PREDICTED: vasoactive intestinal polypeptide receptor 2 [Dipodomys ordii]|uniref:Vasoactive intestinal polypeptide receptor 2 n=1 Tax=Dipodomys ordii TaxID=10020 RepID=A0A1S3GJW9_DIPOR|nr:PREDICTED: vasoactive intestinal polypeptide receptor 2 [Dipodomys ordii]